MPNRSSSQGIVASTGYAAGPLFLMDAPTGDTYRPTGSVEAETARLREAVAQARADLTTLIAETVGDGADVLEFQEAMLEDQSLSQPAYDGLLAGIDAASAWRAALDAEIAGYLAADDDYFRARSSDLADIRDRVLRVLHGVRQVRIPEGAVLFGHDLTPSQFLAANWTEGGAILLSEGSPASHVAMLARARGVPMIVGLGGLIAANDDQVLVDAELGRVIVLPDADEQRAFGEASAAYRALIADAAGLLANPAATSDGTAIQVLVNVAEPADVDGIDIGHCDGIGLMRTEFLFAKGLPDEEDQLAAYAKVLRWAAGKPVTIRTVDAGGDKPVPGFTVEESNPFLGLRGIRLSLRHPEIFRTQVRALLRAAPLGNLKIMFPMVTLASEYLAARRLFEQEAVALGLPLPPLGIMVEVPAAAITPEAFGDAEFFSIGSNDLTQYVMAAARDNGAVAALNDARHPAVLSLIRSVARFGASRGLPVSLCGDAGGNPATIPDLLAAGIHQLSVAPAQLALAKAAIARTTLNG